MIRALCHMYWCHIAISDLYVSVRLVKGIRVFFFFHPGNILEMTTIPKPRSALVRC